MCGTLIRCSGLLSKTWMGTGERARSVRGSSVRGHRTPRNGKGDPREVQVLCEAGALIRTRCDQEMRKTRLPKGGVGCSARGRVERQILQDAQRSPGPVKTPQSAIVAICNTVARQESHNAIPQSARFLLPPASSSITLIATITYGDAPCSFRLGMALADYLVWRTILSRNCPSKALGRRR